MTCVNVQGKSTCSFGCMFFMWLLVSPLLSSFSCFCCCRRNSRLAPILTSRLTMVAFTKSACWSINLVATRLPVVRRRLPLANSSSMPLVIAAHAWAYRKRCDWSSVSAADAPWEHSIMMMLCLGGGQYFPFFETRIMEQVYCHKR